jgi:hypothetical protein
LNFTDLYNDGYLKNAIQQEQLRIRVDADRDVIMLAFMTFTISYQTAQQSYEAYKLLQQQIKAIVAAATPPDFDVEELVEIGLVIIANGVLISLMVSQIIKLVSEITRIYIPKKNVHTIYSLRQLLTAVLDSQNLKLQTNLFELDYKYMPSNLRGKVMKDAFPKSGDYGHIAIDLFDVIKKLTNAKAIVNNNTLFLYKKSDPFWTMNSPYRLKSTAQGQIFAPNVGDFPATRFVTLDTDSGNDWTIEDFDGTNSISITKNKNFQKGEISLLNGYEEIRLPICKASYYTELTEVDLYLIELLKVADLFNKILGKGAVFLNKFKKRFGALKTDKNSWTKPYIIGDVTARKILDNYENENYSQKGQRLVVEGINEPMTYSDFFSISKNSIFTTNEGETGRFTAVSFNSDKQMSTVSYFIEKNYSSKIEETKYDG